MSEETRLDGEQNRQEIEDEIGRVLRALALLDELHVNHGDTWTEHIAPRGSRLHALPVNEAIYSEQQWVDRIPPYQSGSVAWVRPRPNVLAAAGFAAELLARWFDLAGPGGVYVTSDCGGRVALLIEEIEPFLRDLLLELGDALNQPGDDLQLGTVTLRDECDLAEWRQRAEPEGV